MNPYYSINSDRLGSPYNRLNMQAKRIGKELVPYIIILICMHYANNEVYPFFALEGKCRS